MKLIRDFLVKRNIHGYEEAVRTQVYSTWVKQMHLFVVYHVHNDQDSVFRAERYGHWFRSTQRVARYMHSFFNAWYTNQEYQGEPDLLLESIDEWVFDQALTADSKWMYRIALYDFRYGQQALGSGTYDPDRPLFMDASKLSTTRYNIYSLEMAKMIVDTMETSYIGSDYRSEGQDTQFDLVVERASYDRTGNLSDHDWAAVYCKPTWCSPVPTDLNETCDKVIFVQ